MRRYRSIEAVKFLWSRRFLCSSRQAYDHARHKSRKPWLVVGAGDFHSQDRKLGPQIAGLLLPRTGRRVARQMVPALARWIKGSVATNALGRPGAMASAAFQLTMAGDVVTASPSDRLRL